MTCAGSALLGPYNYLIVSSAAESAECSCDGLSETSGSVISLDDGGVSCVWSVWGRWYPEESLCYDLVVTVKWALDSGADASPDSCGHGGGVAIESPVSWFVLA